MEYKVLFFFILTFLEGLYALTVIPSANPVAVGTNVTICLNESMNIPLGTWLFGPSILFMWSSNLIFTGSSYTDRITFNSTSYMLSLSSVTLNNSGLYVLEALGQTKSRGEVYLDVQEPVGNVSLNVSETNLVEMNSSVTFTCSGSGYPMWVTWQNGSSTVTTGEGVSISTDGNILTIDAVTRYDQGPFMCVVANNISMQQSIQISLNVNYGPSDPTLTALPERLVYASGTIISLSCLTDSKPSASISWTYNSVSLNVIGQNLTLVNTSQNQTGQYGCIAYNAVTMRYVTVTRTIRIIDPISQVMVNTQAGYPLENNSFSLNCQIVGSMGSIQWMKNGMYLSSSNGNTFSNQNLTLNFNQLSNSDNGQYQCVASNAVSNMSSVAYNLSVNYGPRNVSISGQDVTSVGSRVTFNCTADSYPQSQYSWFFKGQKVSDGPFYMTGALSVNSSGQYTCLAFNNITGKSSNVSKELSVIVPVTAVTVTPDNQQPIFNQSFTLNCSVSGDVASVRWLKNGVRLYPNNRTFSNNNLTLSFNQLTLQDGGQYQCSASNAISNMTSLAYNLTVNYGPWNTTISGPAVGAVASNVTFRCFANSYPPSDYSWYFNGSKVADGPFYVARAIRMNNSGQYWCMAFNNITRSSNNASVELTIINPISDVTVNTSNQQPVFNQSFTLNCTIRGDVAFIHWLKNGVRLYSNNRTTFFNNNLTFSFNQLTFEDAGQYQCAASNAVSNMTSLAYNLTVNYGPWNTTISGPAVGAVGSNVTFRCSANSQPTSQFIWFFNGSNVADGPVYVVRALTNSSGQYKCMAFNNITRNSNNASVELTIINTISNVFVNSGNQQPIFNQSFTLNCTVSGDVSSIQWMKNGVRLYPNNRTTFSNENVTFSLNQITFSDSGQYQCAANNPVSNMTSLAYNLTVNYGPWNTTISGPTVRAVGSNVTFRCSAISYPTSLFSWFFNGSKVANDSVYVATALTVNSRGQYTCMALNNITRSSKNASVELTVINPISTVTVNTSANQQPVYNREFNLTCTVNGDVALIQWKKNGVLLYLNNRTTYSNNNLTLIFNPLTFEDVGEYQCTASNPVSNMNSMGYNVTVNYGPWNTTITGPSREETGSNVTFTCSAMSRPQSQYSWLFNGIEVASTPVYVITDITLNNAGEYTCLAFNSITGNSSTSRWQFNVYERISSVHVVSDPVIPQASGNLKLKCNVSGPYINLRWQRNNEILQQSDTVTITDNNATVNFRSLQTADNGYYQCIATNQIRPYMSQPYQLVASYGPFNVQILVTPGYMTTFTCKADSQPPAMYQWTFGNNMINKPSIEILWENIPNRNFTCAARNPLTNVTVYTSHLIDDPNGAVGVHASMMLTALFTLLLLTLNECM